MYIVNLTGEFQNENEEAIFHTKSGLLTSKKTANGGIELNFPIEPDSETLSPNGLLESLGVQAKYIGKNRFDYWNLGTTIHEFTSSIIIAPTSFFELLVCFT